MLLDDIFTPFQRLVDTPTYDVHHLKEGGSQTKSNQSFYSAAQIE